MYRGTVPENSCSLLRMKGFVTWTKAQTIDRGLLFNAKKGLQGRLHTDRVLLFLQ
jgi:hypothetical protein